MSQQTSAPAGTPSIGTKLSDPLVAAALIVLAIFGLFSLFLLWQVKGAPEATWLRYTFIFASVEAIAFAAAGALFGTQVSKSAVEREKERADRAESEAQFNLDARAQNDAIRKLAVGVSPSQHVLPASELMPADFVKAVIAILG